MSIKNIMQDIAGDKRIIEDDLNINRIMEI